MIDEAPGSDEAYPPLPDGCFVYRVLTKWEQYDPITRITAPEVYMRRSPHPRTGEIRDASGLSVNLSTHANDEPMDYTPMVNSLNGVKVIFRLRVGDIRAIDITPRLDVIQDKIDHANIIGLPPSAEDVGKRVQVATLLTRIAEVVWVKS